MLSKQLLLGASSRRSMCQLVEGGVCCVNQACDTPACVLLCRYRQHWVAAAGSGAHGVSITSWNEWGEGTQVEPSQPWRDPSTGAAYKDYGEAGPWLYLNITQQQASSFIQAWHDKQQAPKHVQAAAPGAEGSNVVKILEFDVEFMVEVDEDEAAADAVDPAQQESLQVDASNKVEL